MRVLIVDDHRLFAEAIQQTLEGHGVEVCGVVTSGRAALESARVTRPDLVLLDLALPDAFGVEVGARIVEELPNTKVVALTALQDPDAVGEAMRAGFRGFLTKATPLADFVPDIRAVLSGQVVLPHRLAPGSSGRPTQEDATAALLASQLTARERDVLSLLVEGIEGAEMARRLSISPNTVRTHVQSILTKLQVHSRLEAAAFAVKHNVVDVPGLTPESLAG
jgi:two-component system nitrate/nitrite response regulator NarL